MHIRIETLSLKATTAAPPSSPIVYRVAYRSWGTTTRRISSGFPKKACLPPYWSTQRTISMGLCRHTSCEGWCVYHKCRTVKDVQALDVNPGLYLAIKSSVISLRRRNPMVLRYLFVCSNGETAGTDSSIDATLTIFHALLFTAVSPRRTRPWTMITSRLSSQAPTPYSPSTAG